MAEANTFVAQHSSEDEQELDLSNSQLDTTGLVLEIQVTGILTNLNISNNLELGHEGAVFIAGLLVEHLPSLKILDMSECNIGGTGLSIIAAALSSSTSSSSSSSSSAVAKLERLRLRANHIDAEGVVSMCREGIGEALCFLDLSDNKEIGHMGAIALAQLLRESTTRRQLTELRLANCAIGEQGALVLALALSQQRIRDAVHNEDGSVDMPSCLSRLCVDKELLDVDLLTSQANVTLARCTLSDEDVVIVSILLRANQQLETLDLSYAAICGVDMYGRGERHCRSISAFAHALSHQYAPRVDLKPTFTDHFAMESTTALENPRRSGSPGTTVIAMASSPLSSFSSTPATPSSAPALHQISRGLRKLDLSSNFIDHEAAECIAEALVGCHNLVSLNLAYNQIGVIGINLIAENLPVKLEALDLSNNNLGSDGAEAVGALLCDNRYASLKRLGLRGTGIGPEGSKEIAFGIQRNRSLVDIDVKRNSIGKLGKVALGRALLSSGRAGGGAPLRGMVCDEWSVASDDPSGSRVVDLTSRGLEGEDVVLLAGILRRHPHVHHLKLDDNSLGGVASVVGGGGGGGGSNSSGVGSGGSGDGIVALLQMLTRSNPILETVSLARTGLSNVQAQEVLALLRAKPGLRIDGILEGNDRVSSRLKKGIAAQLEQNTTLESELAPINTVKVHVLGYPGVGKTTLCGTLQRTRLSRMFSSSLANAFGQKATWGVDVETVTLPSVAGTSTGVNASEAAFSVWDYAGNKSSQALHSLNLLTSPNSIFVIVLSLTQPREHLRKQLSHWLQLICAACGECRTRDSTVVLVGSGADQVGTLGMEILTKLWNSVHSEWSKISGGGDKGDNNNNDDDDDDNDDDDDDEDADADDARLAGRGGSNQIGHSPMPLSSKRGSTDSLGRQRQRVNGNSGSALEFAQHKCFPVDCRTIDARMNALRAFLLDRHKQVVGDMETTLLGYTCFRVYKAIGERVRAWRARGDLVLRFETEYSSMCRREVSPTLSMPSIVIATRMLHHTGEVLFVEQGRGSHWIVLDPHWLCSRLLGRLVSLASTVADPLLPPRDEPVVTAGERNADVVVRALSATLSTLESPAGAGGGKKRVAPHILNLRYFNRLVAGLLVNESTSNFARDSNYENAPVPRTTDDILELLEDLSFCYVEPRCRHIGETGGAVTTPGSRERQYAFRGADDCPSSFDLNDADRFVVIPTLLHTHLSRQQHYQPISPLPFVANVMGLGAVQANSPGYVGSGASSKLASQRTGSSSLGRGVFSGTGGSGAALASLLLDPTLRRVKRHLLVVPSGAVPESFLRSIYALPPSSVNYRSGLRSATATSSSSADTLQQFTEEELAEASSGAIGWAPYNDDSTEVAAKVVHEKQLNLVCMTQLLLPGILARLQVRLRALGPILRLTQNAITLAIICTESDHQDDTSDREVANQVDATVSPTPGDSNTYVWSCVSLQYFEPIVPHSGITLKTSPSSTTSARDSAVASKLPAQPSTPMKSPISFPSSSPIFSSSNINSDVAMPRDSSTPLAYFVLTAACQSETECNRVLQSCRNVVDETCSDYLMQIWCLEDDTGGATGIRSSSSNLFSPASSTAAATSAITTPSSSSSTTATKPASTQSEKALPQAIRIKDDGVGPWSLGSKTPNLIDQERDELAAAEAIEAEHSFLDHNEVLEDDLNKLHLPGFRRTMGLRCLQYEICISSPEDIKIHSIAPAPGHTPVAKLAEVRSPHIVTAHMSDMYGRYINVIGYFVMSVSDRSWDTAPIILESMRSADDTPLKNTVETNDDPKTTDADTASTDSSSASASASSSRKDKKLAAGRRVKDDRMAHEDVVSAIAAATPDRPLYIQLSSNKPLSSVSSSSSGNASSTSSSSSSSSSSISSSSSSTTTTSSSSVSSSASSTSSGTEPTRSSSGRECLVEMRLYQTLIATNREICRASDGTAVDIDNFPAKNQKRSDRSDNFQSVKGPFELSGSKRRSKGVLWALSTVAMPASLPNFGREMTIDTSQYNKMAVCGFRLLSDTEAFDIIKTHTADLLRIPGSERYLSPSSAVAAEAHDNDVYDHESSLLSRDYFAGRAASHSNEAPSDSGFGLTRGLFVYTHGFGTSPYYVCVNSAVYSRDLRQRLVIAISWPSSPKTAPVSMLSFVLTQKEQSYTVASNILEASVNTVLQIVKAIGGGCKGAIASSSSDAPTSATLPAHAQNDEAAAFERLRLPIFWKAHSMGCLLMLKVLEKLYWEKAMAFFPVKFIMDAPDVPTHYFLELVQKVLASGCQVQHLFNPLDRATDLSRQRHGDITCPGNHCIMAQSEHANLQAIDCSAARCSDSVHHNYGRVDGYALMDQRDFLAGVGPGERLLGLRTSKPENGQDMAHWVLRTGR